MKTIEILDRGQVRVNGEVADYDNLLANLDPIGEYETEDCGTLVLFNHPDGIIELLLDGDFIHGESANFTTCSFEEIMSNYNIAS